MSIKKEDKWPVAIIATVLCIIATLYIARAMLPINSEPRFVYIQLDDPSTKGAEITVFVQGKDGRQWYARLPAAKQWVEVSEVNEWTNVQTP